MVEGIREYEGSDFLCLSKFKPGLNIDSFSHSSTVKNKNERDRGSKQEETKVERKKGGPGGRKQQTYTLLSQALPVFYL